MDAERLVRVVAAAHRRRTDLIPGGRTLGFDGLVVHATGLPDPSMNFCTVERRPDDASSAVAAAAEALAAIGMPFGIELPSGRHPEVEHAVRERRYRLAFRRPVMTVVVGALPSLAPPWNAAIDLARGDEELATLADIDAEVFEVDPAVSRGLYARSIADAPDTALVLARLDGEPVGVALGLRVDATVGVFGVGVLGEARHRGIGGALTCAAARGLGMPDDVAWLFPSPQAVALYERLGFVAGDTWEVWTGPPA